MKAATKDMLKLFGTAIVVCVVMGAISQPWKDDAPKPTAKPAAATPSEPARLSPHIAMITTPILACSTAEQEGVFLARIKAGHADSASQYAAEGVNAGECEMLREGAMGDVMTPEAELSGAALIKIRPNGENGDLWVPTDFVNID